MRETIINYSLHKKSSWFQNKLQGLSNRYFKYKRILTCKLYFFFHPVVLDKSKILPGTIPIFINNFNRFTSLRFQIEWLTSIHDKVSIIVVDNNSDYLPLLEYYKSLNYQNVQVVYLGINSCLHGIGYLLGKLRGVEKYVVTDSDLLPYAETPENIISHLEKLLDKYPSYNHVGPSLEINDIPRCNPLQEKIVHHESQYWPPLAKRINEDLVIAPIDSTFAMYRKTSNFFLRYPALRTARPYTLKHLDWYINKENPTDEMAYYMKTCKPIATWATEAKRNLVWLFPVSEIAEKFLIVVQ